jgi:hypothetical protein
MDHKSTVIQLVVMHIPFTLYKSHYTKTK